MYTDLGIGLWMIGLGVVHLPVPNSNWTGAGLMILGGILYLVGTIGPAI